MRWWSSQKHVMFWVLQNKWCSGVSTKKWWNLLKVLILSNISEKFIVTIDIFRVTFKFCKLHFEPYSKVRKGTNVKLLWTLIIFWFFKIVKTRQKYCIKISGQTYLDSFEIESNNKWPMEIGSFRRCWICLRNYKITKIDESSLMHRCLL